MTRPEILYRHPRKHRPIHRVGLRLIEKWKSEYGRADSEARTLRCCDTDNDAGFGRERLAEIDLSQPRRLGQQQNYAVFVGRTTWGELSFEVLQSVSQSPTFARDRDTIYS